MPPPMTRPVALFALALGIAGCTQTTTPITGDDAGVVDFVGRACNVDAECGALRCDKVRRQCICLSDESCRSADPFAPQRYCNNYTGLCVAEVTGCTSDLECDSTEWCDPSVRACRPLKAFCQPCASDRECGGAQDNCLLDESLGRRFCGVACEADGDCARGATCQDKNGVKQCWPDRTPNGSQATCNNFQACTPDSLRSCNETADCGDSSQRCDPSKGKCVAVQQLCAYGTTCDPRLKLCVAECAQDVDCGDAKLRCVNRVCEPINECRQDADCADNKVCALAPGADTGECRNSCAGDAQCPLGTVCAPSGLRSVCQPGCSGNGSCGLDQRCNATTRQCEGPTVGTTRVCQATGACRSCEFCDGVTNACVAARQSFPYCQPCVSASECAGGTCVTMTDGQGYCARSCGAGQECPQGFVCLSLTSGGDACVPADRDCNGKCP